jgi:hypothetical protein
MNDDLYFIPLLQKALAEPDREGSVTEAFVEIERLGSQPKYAKGLVQYRLFMETVLTSASLAHTGKPFRILDLVDQLVSELATDSFEGSGQEREQAREFLASLRYQTDRSDSPSSPAPCFPHIELIIEKDGIRMHSFPASGAPVRTTLPYVEPGAYALRLSTGRLLWEGDIEEKDLHLPTAFPGRALALAADTGGLPRQASREIELLEGEVTLQVFPGLETGQIEIEVRGRT